MGCNCGGTSDDATAEFQVRLPDGTIKTVKGKAAAEMLVNENGGGMITKKV
jgi:hypothetical protein